MSTLSTVQQVPSCAIFVIQCLICKATYNNIWTSTIRITRGGFKAAYDEGILSGVTSVTPGTEMGKASSATPITAGWQTTLTDGSRSNNRDYLRDVVRSTLSGNPLPGSYWRRQMYEHFQNEGITPRRSWESTGTEDNRHHRTSGNNQAQDDVIVVDISEDEEPQTYAHQIQAYRSLPALFSSSSSDETEESTASDSSTKPDPMVEDQETRERKRDLVNQLLCKKGTHYYCHACSYYSHDQSRLRIHI